MAIGVGLNGPFGGFYGASLSGKTALTGSTFIIVTPVAIDGTTVVLSDNYNSSSSYNLAQSVSFVFGDINLCVYYLINGNGSGPTGTNHTISITGSGLPYAASFLFCEFTSVGAGTFDAAPTGTSSGNSTVNSLTAPQPTTTVPGELVISACCRYANNETITDSGSGFSAAVTLPTNYGGNGLEMISWAVVPTAGTAAGDTYNVSTADYLGALTLTIKPGSTGFALEDEGEWFQYIQVAA